jgi:hypothetical protein
MAQKLSSTIQKTDSARLSRTQRKIMQDREMVSSYVAPAPNPYEQYDSRISELDNDISNLEMRKKEYQQWFQSLSEEKQKIEKKKYYETIRDFELQDSAYKQERWQLQKNRRKISQGYSPQDVMRYARKQTQYKIEKKEARKIGEQKFKKELSEGTLDQELQRIGFKFEGDFNKLRAGVTYGKYIQKAEEYNKDIESKRRLQTWTEKVGYSNLPAFAQAQVNPSAQEWQKDNPQEILVFDNSGNVVGVQSQALGRLVSIEEYNKIASITPQQRAEEWRKDFDKNKKY